MPAALLFNTVFLHGLSHDVRKSGFGVSDTGMTQTGLYSQRKSLEA